MRWNVIIRGLAAFLAGYAAIVVLTTLGFNVWLERRHIYGGGPLLMAEGMFVAMASGLIGGNIAGWIGAKRGIVNVGPVLLPLAAETIWLLFLRERSHASDPFWFSACSAAALMAATLAGGWLRDRAGWSSHAPQSADERRRRPG
jgi:hypothetical protein